MTPQAANDVVRGIGALIDTYTAGPDQIMSTSDDLPITNIVIVGDDSQVPFARLVDNATYSNESDHATTIPYKANYRVPWQAVTTSATTRMARLLESRSPTASSLFQTAPSVDWLKLHLRSSASSTTSSRTAEYSTPVQGPVRWLPQPGMTS